MLTSTIRHKFKALLIHLGVSIVLAILSLLLVFKIWYPAPLHEAIGVTHIFLLVLLVDVIIGPLLTFVVYKPGKKTLKFDLAVIAVLQLAALLYGLHTVMIGRPAWVVYNVDRFDVVRAYELNDKYNEGAQEAYRQTPLLGPGWVAAQMPTNSDERNKLLFEAVDGGADLAQRPKYYAPLEQARAEMQSKARPLAELDKHNRGDEAVVKSTLQQYPEADSFVPLKAPVQDMTVLLKKSEGKVLALVPLKPW